MPWRMIARPLLALAIIGCAGSTTPTLPPAMPAVVASPSSAVATPSPLATRLAPPGPSAEAVVINVTLSDALRIEPARMAVPAGRPVTFVVTNQGALEHEFYLGDEAAQAAHEAETEATGGTTIRDDEHGMGVPPGATKELTFTFPAAGEWLAGCHVTNHYSGGMKARITVTN